MLAELPMSPQLGISVSARPSAHPHWQEKGKELLLLCAGTGKAGALSFCRRPILVGHSADMNTKALLQKDFTSAGLDFTSAGAPSSGSPLCQSEGEPP